MNLIGELDKEIPYPSISEWFEQYPEFDFNFQPLLVNKESAENSDKERKKLIKLRGKINEIDLEMEFFRCKLNNFNINYIHFINIIIFIIYDRYNFGTIKIIISFKQRSY